MSALSTVIRLMLIVVRSTAVQTAARELATVTATNAGRAATAAILRAIQSRKAVSD